MRRWLRGTGARHAPRPSQMSVPSSDRREAGERAAGAVWRRSASRTLGLLRKNWLLLLGLAALAGLVVAVGPGRLGAALAHADRRFLVAMLPCVLAVYVLRAMAWRTTLARLGLDLSRRRTIRIMVAGQALIF
ncbi:MAG TPA: hypothetical protein VFD01_18245, partial [Candidatus Dormibacteraeota bacterium]|nr:hypothetical protein [Candidatus Dormibacteraeota bacterium]